MILHGIRGSPYVHYTNTCIVQTVLGTLRLRVKLVSRHYVSEMRCFIENV